MLHRWLVSEDLGVALHATKALANLDRDVESYKYVDGVHLYHPQYRPQYVGFSINKVTNGEKCNIQFCRKLHVIRRI